MKEVVKIVNKSNNPLPTYQSMGAAGMDIQAYINHRDNLNMIDILPNSICRIQTGIYLSIPEGYECQVRSRSGLAKEGICVINSPGTIDSDYRGEVCILLINHNEYTYSINTGDRIAQLIFNKVEQPTFVVVDSLDSTERGEGGFGSTGK